MPIVFSRTINKYLPQEFAVNQEVVVYSEGKEYHIWSAVKRNQKKIPNLVASH